MSKLLQHPVFLQLWYLPSRAKVFWIAFVLGILFVALLTMLLDPNGRSASLILDRHSPHFVYPFTIQNFEHIIFFMGLGELFVRWRIAAREMTFLDYHLLPEDTETVLQSADLAPIRRTVSKLYDGEHGFLPSLIDLCILQFQSGRSIDQSVSVMTSSLELIQHRVDLRYTFIRYIAWFVPTLGFIGTVFGLGAALASVKPGVKVEMAELAQTLSVGFDCTMVALVESAVLVLLLYMVQEKEEHSVNLAGGYTLRNLINRLYAGA